MNAYKDPSIKGIISSIGGDESIRLLPYINFDIIKHNPKILLWYSDTTVSHFMSYKAGVTSFYGPSIMAWFGENQWLFPYMIEGLEKTILSDSVVWTLSPNTKEWTNESLTRSNPENQNILRKREPATGRRRLQWEWIRQGHTLWWCIEVLEFMKGTSLWPTLDTWRDCILFLEPSEEQPTEDQVKYYLRNYAAQGVLSMCKGILFGRAQQNKDWSQINYDEVLLQVIKEEEHLDIPIITNMDFWHTDPMMTIPYWVQCCIDCTTQTITIPENCCS